MRNKRFFIVWVGANLFALITSYAAIPLFSVSKPDSSKFWPFVNFVDFSNYYIPHPDGTVTSPGIMFYGIFYNYDWSEFLIYVGFVFVILIFRSTPKTD